MTAVRSALLLLAATALIGCLRPTLSDRAANPRDSNQQLAARMLSDTKIAVAGCGAYLNEGVGFEALESEGFSNTSLTSNDR
ncbi:MAG: hypothetical protein AAFN79_07700 [Pseudomonadota bacterium]